MVEHYLFTRVAAGNVAGQIAALCVGVEHELISRSVHWALLYLKQSDVCSIDLYYYTHKKEETLNIRNLTYGKVWVAVDASVVAVARGRVGKVTIVSVRADELNL